MSYVSRAISDEERLISLVRPHWIYMLTGFLWLFSFVFLGLAIDIYFDHFLSAYSFSFFVDLKLIYFSGVITPISALFTLIGVVAFWPFFMTYISSEIGLTNERIVLKRGLIFIEIDQVDLEDIRAEHVQHGLLGWLLKYGKIRLDCRFIQDVNIPAISNPYRFVKASHNARLKHPELEYDKDEFASNIKLIEHHEKHSSSPEVMSRLKNSFKISFWKSAKDRTDD
jgi:hypothetical protein